MTLELGECKIRAMLKKLPNIIDPIHAVQHDKLFVARVNQGLFPRLVDATESQENDIDVSIQFFYDRVLKFPAFEMQLSGTLVLQCQRSLKTFDYPFQTKVKGIFVESMALVEDVPEEVEVYELSSETICLMELVEDELLLTIPLAPVDETTEMYIHSVGTLPKLAEDNNKLETRTNPFAALQGLVK